MTPRFLYILALTVWAPVLLEAQDLPFFRDIQAFKKQDSLSMPPRRANLFIGSSSFTYWKDVADYFPGYPIINRGFGGSSLPDLIRYEQDIIFRYKPRQIIIYCGENDFAASDTVSVATVVSRFQELFSHIRSRYPRKKLFYVSMKPSPSRRHLLPKMQEANEAIRNFLDTHRKTGYIDVYHAMLQRDGSLMGDIYLSDSLHMNTKGYAIWQKAIQPNLVK